jgi:hypothetical protein
LNPFRLDPQLVDRPVRERLREWIVDEAVLLDERESVEARARNDHLKVVTGSRSANDGDRSRCRDAAAAQARPANERLNALAFDARI